MWGLRQIENVSEVKDSTEGERRTADVGTETDGGCECEANVNVYM